MKNVLLTLLMFISMKGFGCSCIITPLIEKYQHSDFIATAKVLKITPDAENKDYHDIEIDLIQVYKGRPVTKLKIISVLNSSCSFYTPENSIWLIFASKDNNGVLSFGSCSGSEQTSSPFDRMQYPGLEVKYKKRIDLKLEVLSFLKRKRINAVNEFGLITNDYNICKDESKGFEEKNRFAVYKIKVNQDLTIGKIKVLREFRNKELSEKLTNCINTSLMVNTRTIKSIPKQTELILIYFYYPSQGKDQSFVSTWDI